MIWSIQYFLYLGEPPIQSIVPAVIRTHKPAHQTIRTQLPKFIRNKEKLILIYSSYEIIQPHIFLCYWSHCTAYILIFNLGSFLTQKHTILRTFTKGIFGPGGGFCRFPRTSQQNLHGFTACPGFNHQTTSSNYLVVWNRALRDMALTLFIIHDRSPLRP
jgi:hypothetical protein